MGAIVTTSELVHADDPRFVRYPIEPIHNDNLVHACLKLGAMYRDARVIVRLKAVSLTTFKSQPQTVMTLDSAAYPVSSNFQARDVTINKWFNFDRNVYYVEVELRKPTKEAQPSVRWVYLAAPLSSSLCPS